MKRLAAALLVALASGCQLADATPRAVTYRVDGTARAVDVTYRNEQGGTQQESGVRVPWSKQFKARPGEFLYLSAQNTDDSGSVAAIIEVDGREFKKSVSAGGYTVATADGSCCPR